MCNHKGCTNFFPDSSNRGKLKTYFSRQGLQNPHGLEDSKPVTLATFPAVSIQLTSIPRVAEEPFHTGWALMLLLQRVGGSPLAEGKPCSGSPTSQSHSLGADCSGPLIYDGKRTKSKSGRGHEEKELGPLWN